MSPHYAAFIRFLESKGATRHMFENELLNHDTSVQDFIAHLEFHLGDFFDSVWNTSTSGEFFSFEGSLHGGDFWDEVFSAEEQQDFVLTEDLLKPFYCKVLTTEEVLALFLKRYRKFSIVKKDIDSNTIYSPYTLLYSALNLGYADKWSKLCDSFMVNDTISGARLLAIK